MSTKKSARTANEGWLMVKTQNGPNKDIMTEMIANMITCFSLWHLVLSYELKIDPGVIKEDLLEWS